MTAHHIYVHVPFCARRCTYCDFSIAVRRRVPVDAYLDALAREVSRIDLADPPKTIYLGGGTPSRLGGAGIARLLGLLGKRGGGGRGAGAEEVTLEANPEDVAPAAARAWLAAGVNRLSLGAQSFEPRVLAWMHRTHDADAIAAAVAHARSAGFTNLSLDLIFALPDSLERDWDADLSRSLALQPDHISLYGLTVEPGTALARQLARGEARGAPEERYEEEYLRAHEVLSAAGFRFYEVSNAARPDHEARHNAAYWRGVPYHGLGPSAHSYDGASRWWNEPAFARWARLLADGQSPVAGREWLDEPQRALERAYLGLRTVDGIEVARGEGRGAGQAVDAVTADRWVRAGWAEWKRDPPPSPLAPRPSSRCLALTPRGWLRLDELVAAI